MIDSVIFHELAELELNEVAEYYETRVAGLGISFIAEVQRIIKSIQNNPEASPKIINEVRRKILWRYPYSIMYSVVKNNILILAIASHKRRPFYWRKRR